MDLKLNSKIKYQRLTLNVGTVKVTFTYTLDENQQKELLLAAGKIHCGIAKRDWNIQATKLILNMPKEDASNLTFENIKNLFEDMVS